MQMKKHMTSIKKSIFAFTILMTFLTVQPVMAQEEFEEDVDDEPAAPIDDYIYYGLIMGVLSGIILLKRKKAV
jgi:uncharacterized membrane-anchored protein YitT (DUF2179 family)